MINLYEALGVHFSAPETEILIALARYQYKMKDQADEQVISGAKQWLLNPQVRDLYNTQLLQEFPDIQTTGYKPEYLGTFFELHDQSAMLKEVNRATRELRDLSRNLEGRISQLRSEEKIYRFPLKDRELLEINYQQFTRNFSSDTARTIYFSLVQILAQHKRPVRYLLYTEYEHYASVRYYEFIVMKLKVSGAKKYILARETPENLKSKGLRHIEPSETEDGSIYRSRILIQPDLALFIEEAALDHMIGEVISAFDLALESIYTFNEAALRIKQQQVERFLIEQAKRTAERQMQNYRDEYDFNEYDENKGSEE